jgi:hypothetical protein
MTCQASYPILCFKNMAAEARSPAMSDPNVGRCDNPPRCLVERGLSLLFRHEGLPGRNAAIPFGQDIPFDFL